MKSQDFDAYADFKQFNTSVADTWNTAFTEALRLVSKPVHDVTLLDYGCGDGKYFAHLVEKRGLAAENIHGVEIAARRVERCREIGWINARLIKNDGHLEYADECFDIVNMMEVIEHIPLAQGRKTLQDLRRVLRPGGILLISTPNYPIKRFYDLSDAIFHRKWDRLIDDPTHVTFYNNSHLRGLLKESFSRIEPFPFKLGFLYRRFPHPRLLHKLFFLCQA
jgi:2-polyprenyl-3-methyl-5-hydroxy-6-metoxy-1,4-benzoquinol methylase